MRSKKITSKVLFQLSPNVRILLIVNALMFFLPNLIFGNDFLVDLLGLRYVFSSGFLPTQLLSYSLVHANFSHLLSNMLGLLVFGPILEMRLGSNRFLFYYFASALGAGIIYSAIHAAEVYPFVNLAQEFLNNPDPDVLVRLLGDRDSALSGKALPFLEAYSKFPNNLAYREAAISAVNDLVALRENSPMVGASGAVYGVMLGFAYLFPNLRMMLLFPPIPVQAKYLVGFYAIAALYYAVEKVPGDNVAHYAHLGGMLVGWLILRFWKLHPQRF